jgi:hypothetical protein
MGPTFSVCFPAETSEQHVKIVAIHANIQPGVVLKRIAIASFAEF